MKMPDDLYDILEQCVLVIYNETDESDVDYGKTSHSSHRIPIFRRLMISTCTVLSVTGAAFNLALIIALLKFRQQTLHNNITNLFVLCLAVSDIFLCSVSMPIQVFYEINEHQMASTGLCRVLFAGFGLPLNISCLSILLIAFDRYRMIVHPMKIQMSTRVAIGLIGFVILFGMVNSVPVALYVTNTNMTDYSYCVENWPSSQMRLTYSVSVFMLYFVLPLTASGGFYLCIYCKLARHATHLRYRKEAERRKRRTTALLVATVVCFVLCWTPWCLYSLLLEIQSHLAPEARIREEWGPHKTHFLQSFRRLQLNPGTCAALLDQMRDQARKQNTEMGIIPGQHIKLIDLLCKMFAMGSTCVNPVLYGWLNEPIQSAMRRQFGRLTDCLKRLHGSGRAQSPHQSVTDVSCWNQCCSGLIRARRSSDSFNEVRSKLVIEPPTLQNNNQRYELEPQRSASPSATPAATQQVACVSSEKAREYTSPKTRSSSSSSPIETEIDVTVQSKPFMASLLDQNNRVYMETIEELAMPESSIHLTPFLTANLNSKTITKTSDVPEEK